MDSLLDDLARLDYLADEGEDSGEDWRKSRVSDWVDSSSLPGHTLPAVYDSDSDDSDHGHSAHVHAPGLRDSPLLGFYDDTPRSDSDSGAHAYRAMTSCPDFHGDASLASQDFAREKELRRLLIEQEATRKRASNRASCTSNPSSASPVPSQRSPTHSRTPSRAVSQEWRRAVYIPVAELDPTMKAETLMSLPGAVISDVSSVVSTPLEPAIEVPEPPSSPVARVMPLIPVSVPSTPIRSSALDTNKPLPTPPACSSPPPAPPSPTTAVPVSPTLSRRGARPAPISIAPPPARTQTPTPTPSYPFPKSTTVSPPESPLARTVPHPSSTPFPSLPASPVQATSLLSLPRPRSPSASSATTTPGLTNSPHSQAFSFFDDSDDEDGRDEQRALRGPPRAPFVAGISTSGRSRFSISSRVSLLSAIAPGMAKSTSTEGHSLSRNVSTTTSASRNGSTSLYTRPPTAPSGSTSTGFRFRRPPTAPAGSAENFGTQPSKRSRSNTAPAPKGGMVPPRLPMPVPVPEVSPSAPASPLSHSGPPRPSFLRTRRLSARSAMGESLHLPWRASGAPTVRPPSVASFLADDPFALDPLSAVEPEGESAAAATTPPPAKSKRRFVKSLTGFSLRAALDTLAGHRHGNSKQAKSKAQQHHQSLLQVPMSEFGEMVPPVPQLPALQVYDAITLPLSDGSPASTMRKASSVIDIRLP